MLTIRFTLLFSKSRVLQTGSGERYETEHPLSMKVLESVAPSKLQNRISVAHTRHARFHVRFLTLVPHLRLEARRTWLNGTRATVKPIDGADLNHELSVGFPDHRRARIQVSPLSFPARTRSSSSLLTKYQCYHPPDYVFRPQCWSVYIGGYGRRTFASQVETAGNRRVQTRCGQSRRNGGTRRGEGG